MFNSTFKIVYFVELMVISNIRKIFMAKYRKLAVAEDRKTVPDMILLGVGGIGMIIPIVYVFSSVLDFADYELPDWLGWAGAVLFGVATWMLWRSHADLGSNWTPTLGIRNDHTLVTNGVFKKIRHPMYAAHLYWAIAQIMMLHNWIAGFSFIIASLPLYFLRIGREEQMMIDKFGNEYKEYMKVTGRFFPRIGKK